MILDHWIFALTVTIAEFFNLFALVLCFLRKKKCKNLTINNYGSLTYVCFVPAKGLIRDLSANSSNIAFEVPLASK